MRGALLALLCVLAAFAIRAPLRPHRLDHEDSVTLARAVDRYDPRHLYPQPPGYPLFILQSKILGAVSGGVEPAFFLGVAGATAVALYALIELARAITATWLYAALLLAINPVFLFTGMTSPLRIYLAAVSTVVAMLCWRAWQGDARAAAWASIALAIGAGYRPELLLLLAPLWAIGVWRAKRFWSSALLLSAVSALWIAFLFAQFPDLHALVATFSKYAEDQARDTSVIFGAAESTWIRTLVRLAMWNGTAIFGWIALAPLANLKSFQSGPLLFLALWILPAIAFHALIHVEDPDHTLATIPAFCLLGGAVLHSFVQRHRDLAAIGLASAAAVNLALFFTPFPLRPQPAFYKPAVDALWQTAYTETHNVRVETDAVLAALQPFAHDEKTLVMWNRSPVTWRTLSYYDPDLTFCLLMDDRHAGTRPHAAFWKNLDLRERSLGDPATVPLGDAERLIWVLGRQSPMLPAIPDRRRLADGVWQSEAAPMNVPGYRLVW